MSTIRHTDCTCAVCNLSSQHPILMSTNTFGSPDLDLRPAEMKRSTMCYWIQECPHCGYTANTIAVPTTISPLFLKSNAYISCSGYAFKSELAKRFYLQYLILSHIQDYQSAYYSLVYTAWSCDDVNDKKLSRICRTLAVALVEKYRLHDQATSDSQIMIADLMRRSRQFQKVVDRYGSMDLRDDLLNRLLRFEVTASKKRDAAAYTVKEAMTKKYNYGFFFFNHSNE